MKRFTRPLAAAAALALGVLTCAQLRAADGNWKFEPARDTYSPDSLLDLRGLNEKFAGEHGFIRLSTDGRDFVMGNGQPIRFWAMHSDIHSKAPEVMADQARFLAKRGVNIVRWHGNILDQKSADLKQVNKEAREKLWQYVAAMKKEGIYMTLSPYYPHATRVNPAWGLGTQKMGNMTGLVFFHPQVQEAYKNWLREIFTPVNPHTGLALKDDPAVAIIQVQNEDSLLFWTIGTIDGKPLEILQTRYGEWAKKKFGSIEQALAAWNNEKAPGDDPAAGRLGFRSIWEATPDGLKLRGGKASPRMAAQAEFYTTLMRDWHAEVARFLRKDLGARQLLNPGNWKTADTVTLGDLERYSYTSGEVEGVNRYTGSLHVGQNNGWAIVAGDKFDKPSRLTSPLEIPVCLKQVAGHPIIIPESNWVPPMYYQSEGPFLVSAYMSLNGVDAYYWFSDGEAQWRQPSSANGYLPSIGKWVSASPMILGNFPAAALTFRGNYLKRGQVVVGEQRSLDDLWNLRVPIISEEGSYDPNRDSGSFAAKSPIKQEVNRLAFLVGPVEVTYGGDPAKSFILPNLKNYIDEDKKIVRSVTGELALDYGQGVCTMNAPKAQGVSGFLKKAGAVKLADTTINAQNDYATVFVVSMDNLPLRTSRRVLIQVGTAERPTGWSERPATWTDEKHQQREVFEITNHGKAPWLIVENDMTITLNNAALSKATILDMNGLARGQADIQRAGGAITLKMPADAMYVVLQ